MVPAVYSVTAAAPSLSLALRKISYTPTARLAVAYRLVPRYDDCYIPSCDCRRIETAPHYEVRGIRPLGNALYLDRLLMGGEVGETLPLTNQRICQDQYLGQGIDVCG